MFAVMLVSFGAGYAVFRTRTGRTVAAVTDVAGWRLQSAVPADEDRREPEQKLDDLLALAAKPSSLTRDRALSAAISAMTAEDFRALVADPLAMSARFEKLSRDTQKMLAEAMMDRWLEIDADGALAWLKAPRVAAETALRPDQSFGMLSSLARWNPERLLELARAPAPRLDRSDAIYVAMEKLAANNPAEAQRKLATFDQEKDRRLAMQGFLSGWASVDPKATAVFARSLTDLATRKSGFLGAVYSAADKGSAAVAEIFQLLPEELRRYKWSGLSALALAQPAAARQLLGDLVSQQQLAAGNPDDAKGVSHNLGTNDPVATARWIDSWNDEMLTAVGSGFRLQFVQGWAESNPAAAFEWALAQSQRANTPADDLIRDALQLWLNDDRSAASAWIEALPAGKMRERASQALAEYLFQNGDSADAALAYSAGAAADTRGEVAQRFASAFANKDVSAAAEWSLTLPAGAARFNAIKATSSVWLAKDPRAAMAWFEQLPGGSDHDATASAFAAITVHADPSAAVEWVGQITDPKARADAAISVFEIWSWTDPQGARAWLRNLSGVDEHWKETYLRRAR